MEQGLKKLKLIVFMQNIANESTNQYALPGALMGALGKPYNNILSGDYMTKREKEKQEAIEFLLNTVKLKPGETIFTILRGVSKSGMYRTVDVYCFRENEPLLLSHSVSKAIGFTYDNRKNAVGVSGCGMDVGFEIVYNLGRVLFKDGFDCAGEKCQSNDHFNHEKNDHHKDGGYAFRHRWM